MRFRTDPFVLALILCVITAYFFPEPGIGESWFPIKTISSIGISLIFFFYGLKLSPDKLKKGLNNWKLHLVVQLSTFVLFPLLVLPFYPFMQSAEQHTLWLAVFFLASLPSTVSSSVVMVSMAGGNIPAAIFNASLSGMIGILVTPLWITPFLEKGTADLDFTHIYMQLAFEVIIPVVLGILLQPLGGKAANRYSRQLSLFDKAIILLIVYKSFAGSFYSGIFRQIQWGDIALLILISLFLFFVAFGIIYLFSKWLRFNREDRITAFFCGSKKSLVHGTVMSKVLFSKLSIAGIVLLPLMLYHGLQILLVSIIASRFSRETLIQDQQKDSPDQTHDV
ncbi:bile acid:sodium symporter family protein [Sinomicrobium weinanense]|uniref:Bile acid:sodium symporter n=1 Tax=Sinomicrobium weinanense TaxID=2842200 RepID=A0A926JQ40_9FLAO|nr:bile acid:sodium symporter family protein [Sinomicrobium weinanense]MBC9795186.1 bile acid:sodium symporter [Sinomicrobium weinanense]MBU3121963.1 bile acid:sodium symporter [Sinomicrobium weinanense]